MRVFVCLFISFSILISCSSSEDARSNSSCSPILVDQDLFNENNYSKADLDSYNLEGSCLEVTIYAGGCNSDHVIEMITTGALIKTNPPQIEFDFWDVEPQPCNAWKRLERSFDLSGITDLHSGDVYIRFRDKEDFTFLYKP